MHKDGMREDVRVNREKASLDARGVVRAWQTRRLWRQSQYSVRNGFVAKGEEPGM